MARVLVTGAGGFIGSKLVRKLMERGDDVVCLAHHHRYREQFEALGVRIALGDIRSLDSLYPALDGMDMVYHLAARLRALSTEIFYTTNTLGMENIAKACAAQPTPPVLLIVSSLAAGGPSRLGHPRSEADRPAPISHYGRSKLAGELAAARMAGDVAISIVRPPFVFGDGDRSTLPIFRSIKQWKVHAVPSGNDLELTLIHVDDLVEGLIAVAFRGERLDMDEIQNHHDRYQKGMYYIGDPEIVTYSDYGRLISRAFHGRVRILRVRRPVLWTVAAVNELTGKLVRRARVMNLDKYRESMAPGWTSCTEKIRQQLGFVPATSLAGRVRQAAEWYLREGWI